MRYEEFDNVIAHCKKHFDELVKGIKELQARGYKVEVREYGDFVMTVTHTVTIKTKQV